ncbi:MAG: CPBP family intramembrane metalloprotease [Bacteroidales bacterium]|nr:CPBP family intramembrane metalloprotease [Bacteroidales bacterium]
MTFTENFEIKQAVFSLALTIAVYYAYYFPAFSAANKKWFQKNFSEKKGQVYLFIFQKTLGFLLLGLVPGMLFSLKFNFSTPKHSAWGLTAIPLWVYPIILLLIVFSSVFSSRKPDVNSRIPQMRLPDWGFKEIAISISGWAIYLLGYEFLFRGLLLFTTAEAFGIMPAMLINIGLYSAFHLPNGMKETLAAIPFGLILCVISLISCSFIPAFLLHLSLSISAEMFSVHFNPNMKFLFSKKIAG